MLTGSFSPYLPNSCQPRRGDLVFFYGESRVEILVPKLIFILESGDFRVHWKACLRVSDAIFPDA